MNISDKGLNLIKEFEGCRLTAYRDSVGVWTIGWGTTSADKSITGTNIYEGLKISQSTADEWLRKSVNQKYVPKVTEYESTYHWNQNQLDSLTSFAYNIGSIDQLTANGTRSIAEISNKILAYDKAGGQTLAGLTRRRKAEKELFDTPCKNEKWVKDSLGWKYQMDDGKFLKRCWRTINGKEYYFHANGYMASDEYIKSTDYLHNGKLYYVNFDGDWNNKTYTIKRDKKGRWLAEVGSKWYAKNSWAKINKRWYYFGVDGYMYINTVAKIEGTLYSFDGNGALKK